MVERPIPTAKNVLAKIDRSHKLTYKGTDFIGIATIFGSSSIDPYAPAVRCPISPSLWDETRVQRVASTYERYRFLKLEFRYVSAVPSNQGGQLAMWVDQDPDDTPEFPAGSAFGRFAAVNRGNVFNAFNSNTLRVQLDGRHLYTGATKENMRKSAQGILYLGVMTPLASSTSLGAIYVDYTIEFDTPTLDPIPETCSSPTFFHSQTQVAAGTAANAYFVYAIPEANLLNAGIISSRILNTVLMAYPYTVGSKLVDNGLDKGRPIYLRPIDKVGTDIHYHVYKTLRDLKSNVEPVKNEDTSAWTGTDALDVAWTLASFYFAYLAI